MRKKKAPTTARSPARSRRSSSPTKGEQTQARLVDAAIDVFARQGFHGTKISDIVVRADVSQPAFYLYFSSKQQIYNHVVGRVRNDLIDIIKHVRVPAHLDTATATNKVIAAVKAFLEYFEANPKLAVIGYFKAEQASAVHKEIIAFVSRNVAAEQSAGYFRDDFDPAFLAESYIGTLDRLINRYLLTGKMTAAELADKVADIYLRGILLK